METQKRKIAAFDFDGTITTKDTLFDFIIFYWGKPKLILGLLWLFPILLLFKLGFIPNYKAKQKLFSYFFKGVNVDEFNSVCLKYAGRVDEILRKETVNQLQWHKKEGHEVIIISASMENWISPWALSNNIKTVLATQIETHNDILTGCFSSKNCYGQEKVNRLREKYPDREDYILYAYGDSNGDKELLAYSDYPTLYK